MNTIRHKIELASDAELIKKIIGGETSLFEVLIRRYNSLLYKMARTYGLNHQDAEDVMQETHFVAFTKLTSFRNEASYKTWLTKILLHKCYHKTNNKHSKFEESNTDFLSNDNLPKQLPEVKFDTQKMVINKELAAVLEQSLQQLPLPYRCVFVLREIEGFNVEETSALLNISAINVRVRLNRAKAMMQKELEKYYSSGDIYEFHLMHCDKIVKNVFAKLASLNQ
jgi:RNA polymerase sigma factor (sigma-70 family)